MICLVENGKEIGRLVPYGESTFMCGLWWSNITDWGTRTSNLQSHLRNIKQFFPDVEFIYVP